MADLLQRCQSGDQSAIQDLVLSHRQAVFRLALSILDDPAEADEATQDAFVAALSTIDSYRGEASLTTWLYAITTNVCRSRLRKRRTKERIFQALQTIFRMAGEGLTRPEETVIQRESDAALWQAVNGLGEKHRLPVILFYFHDLPVAEIAQVLGLRPGTVLSRLYTARERLRARLNGNIHSRAEVDEYDRD